MGGLVPMAAANTKIKGTATTGKTGGLKQLT